jgi:spore coat-associated protein N
MMAVLRMTLPEVLELAFPASVRRIFVTLVVLSAASFVVNQGTAASFTATVRSPNNTFSTGSLELTTSAGGSALFTLSGLVPGDVAVATIDLRNAGSIDANTYTMATAANVPAGQTPSVLTSDATRGLQLAVDRCSVAWTGPAPYTCTGTATRNVVAGPIVQSSAAMGRTLPAGTTDYLRIAVSLPEAAGNALSSQSATVTFRWDIGQ